MMNDYNKRCTIAKGKFYTNSELIDRGRLSYIREDIEQATDWYECAFTSQFQEISDYVDYIHLLVKSNRLDEAAKTLTKFNELYPIRQNPKSIVIYLPAAALAIALKEEETARKFLEEYIIYSQFENTLKYKLPARPPYWSIIKATDLEIKKHLDTLERKREEDLNKLKLEKLIYYIQIGKRHFKDNYLSWLTEITKNSTNKYLLTLKQKLATIFKSKGDDFLSNYFS